ncbi:MAG: serine/threonine protein kinase [Planctomycetes bacterium]|nr:serine/threonine protein kinase [Planctomycetota bacterium]
MPNAQDEAIVLAAVQRRLLDPKLIPQARELCQSQGSGMAMALRKWIEPAKVGALLAQLALDTYRCPSRTCQPTPFGQLVAQDRMRCSSCDRPLVRTKGKEAPLASGDDFLAAPTTEASWGHSRRMGPYLLVEEIGRGSMGVVFLARRDDLPRRLALKVVLTHENDPEALARFQREAAVAARLEHPGIVGVYDVGREGRYRYYAMDYCEGETLAAVLQKGPLPPLEAASLVLELARALDYAHLNQVFHRDLKPANVLIDPHSGRPRVTDFGLARDASRRDELTKTGDILGTPLYMSPEQTVGQKGTDGRMDVYALGVVLYECLTGTPPYRDPDPQVLFRLIREGNPRRPRKLVSRVPVALEQICLRAMEADPDERTASAGLLASELEAFLEAPEPPTLASRIHPAAIGALGTLAGVVIAIAFVGARDTPTAPTPTPSQVASLPASPATPAATPARPSLPPDVDRELNLLVASAVTPFHRDATPELEYQFQRIRTRGPILFERYPGDSRAIFLAALVKLLGRTTGDFEVRRELLRAIRAEPRLPDEALTVSVLVVWTLGFARAADDLCEPSVLGPGPSASCSLNLLHIQMKAVPPVRDIPGATLIAEAALRLRVRNHPGPGDHLLVPTWDLHCNLAELHLIQGSVEKAALGYDAAERSTQSRRRSAFGARAREIRSGKVTPADGTRNISTMFPFTDFGRTLARLERLENKASGFAAADQAASEASALQKKGQLSKAAVTLVLAGRALLRADRIVGAIKTLRRAARLSLPEQDADVRALVCRTLASALLLATPGVAPSAAHLNEAQALATEALTAGRAHPKHFTRGEIADAWVLVGRAELLRGAKPEAKAAYEAALALEPYDRRELTTLGEALGLSR